MTAIDGQTAADDSSHCPRERTGLPRPRKRHWRIVLLMLIVFIAGGVVGSAGTVIWAMDHFQHIARHPEEAPRRITARMAEKLDLTDEQAEQVREILERRQQDLMVIHHEIRPRVEEVLNASRAEIAAVLNDQQQAEWEEMYQRFDRRWMPYYGRDHRNSQRHNSHRRHDQDQPGDDGSTPTDASEDARDPGEAEPAAE